jgi:hypothetical protein
MNFLSFLFGGPLTKAFDLIDKKIQSGTDKEAIKGDIVKEYYKTRPAFMEAGGFYLMLIFVVPLGFWFAAVCFYSVFFCAGCVFPQTWTIAALPQPLKEWSGAIILSIFGVFGVGAMGGRR